MISATLYTTLGCHLCDEAKLLLVDLMENGLELSLTEIDIADSDDLIEQYGIRIPVIRTAGSEDDLGWPFNSQQLQTYLTT